jgi:hypothetical protein
MVNAVSLHRAADHFPSLEKLDHKGKFSFSVLELRNRKWLCSDRP